MKQSRKIRRCWLRHIPEWMRCFARSVVRVVKLSSSQVVKSARKVRERCASFARAVKSAYSVQRLALADGVRAHTKEWAAAMLAAGLIAAPYSVDMAAGGWQLAAVNAAPEGGVVVGGAAQISAAGNVTTISQTSARAAIDWASFDIAKQETVTFQQPNTSAVALNRILGNNPTAIYGQLNANGQVYLSNPNGMLFAPGAQINVAGLIATTSHVDPLAFMQTGLINTSERNGAINMQGSIFANGGLVEIKGATAINVGGLIQATTLNGNGGVIALGNNARLDVNGASLFARGSDVSGDGGFIETSGDIIAGLNNVTVNAGSDNGNSGTWLIDPQDYNIGGANSDMSGVVLGNNLNTQNMIILSQSGTHTGLGDVNVVDAISWTANNSLSLSAFRDVNVSANVVNTGTGSVTLQSDNTGIGYVGASTSGGTVNFYNSATIGLLNADSGGYVNIYYNPGSYNSPNNYTANISAFTGHDTAYMLVNQLGAAADGVSIHSLAALSRHSSLWSDAFALGTNITATATSLWNTSLGFEPIGNATTKFSGKFDGLGNTLSDLFINRTAQCVGLFGYVEGANAMIGNLNLKDVRITGFQVNDAGYVGGVAGYNDSGTISNVTLSGGAIRGEGTSGGVYVGGLAGLNYAGAISGGSITDLVIGGSATSGRVYAGSGMGYDSSGVINAVTIQGGTITGSSNRGYVYVGGVAGYHAGTLSDVKITGTTFSGNSSGGSVYVGGVAGYNSGVTINNVTITGATLNGSNTDIGMICVGGVVGDNDSGEISAVTITDAIINASETGDGYIYAGGVAGFISAGTISNITISNSTISASATSGGVYVGGAAGYKSNGVISAVTMNAATLSGTNVSGAGKYAGGLYVGGLVGYNNYGAVNGGDTRTTLSAGNIAVSYTSGGNVTVGMTGTTATIAQVSEGALTLAGVNVNRLTAGAAEFAINENLYVANDLALTAYGVGVTAGHIRFNGAPATVGGSAYLTARPMATKATDLILATGGIFGAYSVYDYADLNNVRNDLSVNAVYNQLANIDASGATDLVPIGNNTDKFLGKYAGNGNSISNLVINQTGQYVGLFGYVSGANATISNLNLVHANISGYQTSGNVFVGGIVGWNNAATLSGITLASSTISGSSSSGDVYGGGIAGRNIGSISDITLSAVTQNSVSVSGDVYSSGAAGYNDGAITGILVNDSAIKGSNDLTGSVTVGGAAGRNNGTIINVVLNNTTLSGDNVSNGNVRVGGAAGYNFASSLTVSNVQVNGSTIQGSSVDGDVRVGGIAGRNNSFINAVVVNGSTISGTNTTTGVVAVGGIAGENYALISGGVISVSGSAISGRSESAASVKVGGFAGWNHDDIIGADFNEGTISASAHASVVMVGGAVGHNNAAETISNVIISNTNISGNSSAEVVYLGGVAGNNEGTVSGGDTRTTLSAGNISVNYTSSGNITVGMTGTAATITQVSEGSLTLAGANVSSGGLTVIATGTVTQSDMITVNGLTTVAAGDNNINLSNAANNFTGNFSASGGTIAVAAKTAFTVANISGSGTVLVNYTGIDPAGGITIANGGRIISTATASGTIATMMLNAGVGLFNNLGAADSIQAPTGRWQLYAVDENRITGTALTANAGLYYSAPAFDSANWSNIPRINNRLVFGATHAPYAVDAGNNGYREYGDPNSTITNYYSIAVLLPGDSAAAEVPLFTTTATTASGANVGYELTLTELVGAASDYNIAFALGVTDGTFAINKAPLTITAANKSKVYGTTDPVLTANYSGFKNSDTASVVSGFSMSTVTGSAATVGEHPIVASGGVAANYLISDVDGTLTVTPATEANAAEQARQAAIIAANQQNNAAGSSANQKQTTNQLTIATPTAVTSTSLAGGLVSLTGVDSAIRLPESEQSADKDKVAK